MASHAETSAGFEALAIRREAAIDWVTLNRSDRLNAIDGVMTAELYAYFTALARDEECRVVILRGAGRAFCSGLDLKAFDPDAAPSSAATLPSVIRAMRSCPQPIIALLRGAAAGGGFSLALAADIRIATPDARMNVAYVKLGVSGCELGTSYHLPRTVGPSVANELMMTGRFIHADRALATGLVSEVVDDADLDDAGRAMAEDMLRASPIGLRKTKQTVERVGRVGDLDAALDLEEQAQRDCMRDPAFARAVAAFKGA